MQILHCVYVGSLKTRKPIHFSLISNLNNLRMQRRMLKAPLIKYSGLLIGPKIAL